MTKSMTRRAALQLKLLAATAPFAPVAMAQSTRGTQSADLVLTGGRIVTLDARSSIAEAVAVRDGRIFAVGTAADIKPLIGAGTSSIDLKGRTVIPGLIDTHTHSKAAGERLYTVNMREARTVPQALEAVRSFVADKKPGRWIVGSAWHPPSQLEEKRYLTRQEIDRVAPDNPVFLPTVGHFVMSNSRALAAAGITKETPNPAGGAIERDAAGEATGVLVGPAIGLLAKAVPPWTFEDVVNQYKAAMAHLNSFGLTSTVDGGLDAADIRVLRHLASAGEATVRMAIMYRPQNVPATDTAKWEDLLRGNGAASGFGDEWLRFAGVKFALDGGMTLRTANTRESYPDDASYFGQAYMTPEVFAKLVEISDRNGWRVGVHVVGDKAVDVALDAFDTLDRERPIRSKRFVLIHGSLVQRDQMERAKRLGLRVDVQNVFMWDKATTVERFLGAQRAGRAVPTRTLIDVLGIESLGAGTDFPVNGIDPFLNMYIMVSRKSPDGARYGPSEAISREEALRLYTTSAAHYTFEEKVKGSIEAGKLADLVVLSADPLTVPEEGIKDIHALTTIVAGKVVYERKA
jgi:predicted amidohydrolase YtcJ